MKDLVTVFTPVYNRKNLIGNLYQSLLSQTYKNLAAPFSFSFNAEI